MSFCTKANGGSFNGAVNTFTYSGQAAVECAFLIPVALLLLMLLIQPGILLYNHMVMKAAAAEGCRLLATQSVDSGTADACETAIRRHLGSIPQQENFHIHQSGCSWQITLMGADQDSQVSVEIANQVKPLPFFDFAASAVGLTNGDGNFEQRVEVQQTTKSAWLQQSEDGLDPYNWVHRDDES